MQKRVLADIVKDEIKIWERRVFYPDLKFKENTPADLGLLEKKVVESNTRDTMLILSSETEACIYKIGRFLVEIGVKNSNVTFLDGDLLTPYVDVDSKHMWQSRGLIDKVIEGIQKDIYRKWVFIPELNCEWSKPLAMYFITQLENCRAYGIIFYSNINHIGNLAETLIESTNIDVFQFPKPRYKPKKEKELAPDEY